jgi:hypothetical protein
VTPLALKDRGPRLLVSLQAALFRDRGVMHLHERSEGRTVPRECFNLQKYGGESQRSIGRSYGAVYVTQQCHAVEHIVKAFSRRHALR